VEDEEVVNKKRRKRRKRRRRETARGRIHPLATRRSFKFDM